MLKFDRFLDAFWEGSGAAKADLGTFGWIQSEKLGPPEEGRVEVEAMLSCCSASELSCCSASELKCHVSCAELKYPLLNAQPMGWRIQHAFWEHVLEFFPGVPQNIVDNCRKHVPSKPKDLFVFLDILRPCGRAADPVAIWEQIGAIL